MHGHGLAQLITLQLIADTLAGDDHVDRLGEVIHRAQCQRSFFRLGVVQCRHKNHRNVPQSGMRSQLFEGFEAVDFRHHHVKQNQIRLTLERQRNAVRTGNRTLDIKLRLQNRTQGVQIDGLIVDGKNAGTQCAHGVSLVQARPAAWAILFNSFNTSANCISCKGAFSALICADSGVLAIST